MTAAVLPAGRLDAWSAPGAVAAGLAIAARSRGVTFIALPAPVVSAAVVAAAADAFDGPRQPRVAWTTSELSLAGVGCARELRGAGRDRFADLVAAARELDAGGAVIAGELMALAALGVARPRLIGGAAFAPGAADRAPWAGFGDAWFMLPRWTYVHDGARAQLVLAVDAAGTADSARWHAELAVLSAALEARGAGLPARQPAPAALVRGDAAEWRAQIASIDALIAHGACSKIVAARTCSVEHAGAISLPALLAALEARHADCVRVLIQPPGSGALVAATPEWLVRRDGERVHCDALAGTRRAIDAGDAAELLVSGKDRREHALVVAAIRDALAGCAGVDAIDAPAEPAVRLVRQIAHLYTPVRARLRGPGHVLELAERLHPTPAVGGTPLDVAAAWIERCEPAARGWYAAPVGWFDLDGNGELAVAIRSGLVTGSRAHLWAGAGIVAGSDADHELAETELKFRPMLGALGVAGGPVGAIGAAEED